MTRITKLIAIIAASAGGAGVMVTTNPVNVSANTKFRYYKNIKDRTYKVTNKKAVIYSNGKIKHKTGAKLGEYGKYVTGYYSSHVTVNGHKRVYYKFKTGSNHTGWVWNGYLKKVSNKSLKTTSTYNPYASSNWNDESDFARLSKGKKFTMNLSDYRKGFLDTVNAERAKRGISALNEDPGLNNVAQKRSVDQLTNPTHYTSDGKIAFVVDAKAAGINYAHAENIGNTTPNMISHGLNSDLDYDKNAKINVVIDSSYNAGKAEVLGYIYDDADSNYGHRNNLLNPSYNVIGVGGSYVPESNTVSETVWNATVLGTK
ncbi:CAP domain-containing protein [Levilactobacillus fuyuanensis]|uniref:CAP domain-containing protein n=1 Tax=Levilactobacillus fuyuanensis TaxID=2486022 RepID=A0ABW4H341_9LACO|nr:CAP domain-containing protein [Levilactobacillus fuyuanensis]